VPRRAVGRANSSGQSTGRIAEWHDYTDHRKWQRERVPRSVRADTFQRDARSIREAWFSSNAAMCKAQLANAVAERGAWARLRPGSSDD
jgi:hypothetical protein